MARVLVLDDDVNIVKIVEAILTAQGHDVIGTTHAHEAFEAVQKAPFDLLILDLIMPEFSGQDFMNALRVLFGFQTPILILSGQGSLEAVKETLEQGASDFLVKPFEAATLIGRIDAILSRKMI